LTGCFFCGRNVVMEEKETIIAAALLTDAKFCGVGKINHGDASKFLRESYEKGEIPKPKDVKAMMMTSTGRIVGMLEAWQICDSHGLMKAAYAEVLEKYSGEKEWLINSSYFKDALAVHGDIKKAEKFAREHNGKRRREIEFLSVNEEMSKIMKDCPRITSFDESGLEDFFKTRCWQVPCRKKGLKQRRCEKNTAREIRKDFNS